MSPTFCSHCLTPLSRRERLFDSLLCIACEQKMTDYEGPLPNPNLAFAKRSTNQDGSEVHLLSAMRRAPASFFSHVNGELHE